MNIDLSSTDLWRAFGQERWGVIKRAWSASNDDNLGIVAAGSAFYIIASIAPILAGVVLSYGLFADAYTVQSDIRALFVALPKEVALVISQQLDTVVSGSQGKKGVALLVAALMALYGGTKAATSMMTALNIAFEVKDQRGIIVWMLTAFLIVLGVSLSSLLRSG